MTTITVRAWVNIGKVDDYNVAIPMPSQPDMVRLRLSQFEAPTVRANLRWRAPIVADATQLLPSYTLHWLSIDAEDGRGGSRRFNLWIRELKETISADDYSLEIEAVSADYFLTVQRIREDVLEGRNEIPSSGETLGAFWGRIFRRGGIVAGTPSGYSSIDLLSDMDYSAAGAPVSTPRIPVEAGATLWDSAYIIAQHWRAYVDGSRQPERDQPSFTLTPWELPAAYGRDLRSESGLIVEISRESNFEQWGERIRNTRRWWELQGGELTQVERVSYYGQGGTLGKTLDVETIGNLEPVEAMQARAMRVRNRITKESVTLALDLDLDLGVGVWIDGTGSGHLERRITAIDHDINAGLTTIEVEPSLTPVYIRPWSEIDPSLTWGTLFYDSWTSFDGAY